MYDEVLAEPDQRELALALAYLGLNAPNLHHLNDNLPDQVARAQGGPGWS